MGRSRPSRGAWIETLGRYCGSARRSCRALHGARGLKPHAHAPERPLRWSRPSRGAWIETRCAAPRRTRPSRSRPSRGAWIETSIAAVRSRCPTSRPSRGAWIETCVATAPTTGDGRRALHGARGLKLPSGRDASRPQASRALHGARGLKHLVGVDGLAAQRVAPFTGRVD